MNVALNKHLVVLFVVVMAVTSATNEQVIRVIIDVQNTYNRLNNVCTKSAESAANVSHTLHKMNIDIGFMYFIDILSSNKCIKNLLFSAAASVFQTIN